ncbi:4-alpha-glucanotransferase [Granulicella sibirica]|uniref:4-alpha-glucanotransferase n=1 Tax=Granulicella sibirica TaxID=2479048 RepID=A0A4Q0SWN5_9BACT|nr:4-alpha-glucanotransferase [Granulicella sibirica]RXH53988.1 4-alpha-glucanotransferase (amylomaltase) [Granulicella sibirica]
MSNLVKLAQLLGIQDVIPTRDGQEQPISDATRRSLLKSVGIDAKDEDQAQASLLTLEDSSWTQPLPPVLVTQRGKRGIMVPVTLDHDTETLRWSVTLEDHREHFSEVSFRDLELIDQKTLNRRTLERRNLFLTAEIPDGYHDLRMEGVPAVCRLIVTPETCWLPTVQEGSGRIWGVATQLYLLRSEQNWGIGDYSDLKKLLELAKKEGADIVGVNPLHAMFLDKPGDASPYSPSDRMLLNVLNIDLNDIPELAHSTEARTLIESAAFQTMLRECREANLLDYEKVAATKLPILRLLFSTFDTEGHSELKEAFTSFHEERSDVLDRSCLFQALRMYVAETDSGFRESQVWPEQYRDAKASGVEEFTRREPERIRFQLWLQWTADRQLKRAHEAAAGMKIGLYRDLAVGSHASGAETWSRPDLFAADVQIGAPPDQFNPAGQNWGLPPLNPQAMQRDGYRTFIELLRANMRYAGALRIDHVMALRRLYWIPPHGETKDGAYVFYPIDDLVGIIALESQRNCCVVIGEDLGGVPDGFRERMAEANILSYRVLAFERGEESFHTPNEYPHLALSVAGNHDLPTLPGWWCGNDIELRERLKLFPDADSAQQAREMRSRDRAALMRAFAKEGLLSDQLDITSAEFCQASHEFLARTRSLLTIVQLDDLMREPEQVNVPGTSNENPNWRRKLSRTLEQMDKDESLSRLSSLMQSAVATT